MDALVMLLEIRRDIQGNGRRTDHGPVVTILAFDDHGPGSRAELAELANLPGLLGVQQ